MGITLREIIYDIGGGISDGGKFKAIQTGGPSGGCIPESLIDLPVDYESLTEAGAIMGSGGMVVMDDKVCMVDIARFFLTFTADESCGKCAPCRIGTFVMNETLRRICEGQGKEGDLEFLEELAETVKALSLCGLGQTAPNPVLTTLKYFREEYEAHLRDKRCPSKVCKRRFTSEEIARLKEEAAKRKKAAKKRQTEAKGKATIKSVGRPKKRGTEKNRPSGKKERRATKMTGKKKAKTDGRKRKS